MKTAFKLLCRDEWVTTPSVTARRVGGRPLAHQLHIALVDSNGEAGHVLSYHMARGLDRCVRLSDSFRQEPSRLLCLGHQPDEVGRLPGASRDVSAKREGMGRCPALIAASTDFPRLHQLPDHHDSKTASTLSCTVSNFFLLFHSVASASIACAMRT